MSNLKIYVDIHPELIIDHEIDEDDIQIRMKIISQDYDKAGHGYSVKEVREDAIRQILDQVVQDNIEYEFEEKEYKDEKKL